MDWKNVLSIAVVTLVVSWICGVALGRWSTRVERENTRRITAQIVEDLLGLARKMVDEQRGRIDELHQRQDLLDERMAELVAHLVDLPAESAGTAGEGRR